MKRFAFIVLTIISCQLSIINCYAEDVQQMIDRSLDVCTRQSLILAKAYEDKEGALPRNFQKGKLHGQSYKNWTCGFFPGTLWYLYEIQCSRVQADSLRYYADLYTKRCEEAKNKLDTHDLGFMLWCSYGNAYRITKDKQYLEPLQTGAANLATRFNKKVGLIQSWGSGKWKYPVIIDNMLNLEFLVEMGYKDLAMSHADRTMKNHFRDDYSCYHVVSYNPETGDAEVRCTHQGLADSSAWARGQAWALYGYTMMYRETGKTEYLSQAKSVANFIMTHPRMPKDKVPYWDFDAPDDSPRDASAAACMASALIELSELDTDIRGSQEYLEYAISQLRSLSSPKYLSEIGENGGFILMHSVGNMKKNSEVDVPLTYADYYYVEALLRLQRAIESRRCWIRHLDRVAYPVVSNLSQGTLKQNMPFESIDETQSRKPVCYLEAVGRTLYGISAWLGLEKAEGAESVLLQEYRDMVLKGLKNAVNPSSPDHLLFTAGKERQPLVDAAYLAQALLQCKSQIWDKLDKKTQKRLIEELKSTRKIGSGSNNWKFFASLVECALLEFSGECDIVRLFHAVDFFMDEGPYKGDAWYGDGQEFHLDYYNSLVIHPMLWQTLQTINKFYPSDKTTARIEREKKRLSRMASILERLIAPDGTYPCVGRSITYRCGVFNALGYAALNHNLDKHLAANQVRSALSAVINRQLTMPGTFEVNGWLRVGFAGCQIRMGEKYINTGSDYLCSAVFLPLGLPKSDLFWSGAHTDWTNKKAWQGTDIGCDHALRDLNK